MAPGRTPRGSARHRLGRSVARLGLAGAGRHTLVALAVLSGAVVAVAPHAAASSIQSDQSEVGKLAQEVVSDGAAVQQAVVHQDAAQARLETIDAQLAASRTRLAAERRADAAAARVLKRLLIEAYTTGETFTAAPAIFGTQSADGQIAGNEYSHVASSELNGAITTYEADQQRTKATETSLEAEQVQASASVAQLATAAQRAQAALARDTTLLAHVQDNLAVLEAAAAAQAHQQALQEEAMQAAAQQAAAQQAAAQQAAAQQAAAQQAAAQQAAAQQAASTSPVSAGTAPAGTASPGTASPPSHQSPGGYADPLRSISALSPERIDQGVDYSGYGPIYAVGDGVVLNTVNAGWPGGTFITYRLTDGPAAGLVVYVAEDVEPLVQVGQQVTPATVLGTMYEGPDGIETGWSDPSGQGYTMAHDYDQFDGANSTAFGDNFSQLLASLGAPPGVLQNTPPTGTLPTGWPTW
jgi:murein DD-endopeptidase MepM/ murein hydrolase activator NlpD